MGLQDLAVRRVKPNSFQNTGDDDPIQGNFSRVQASPRQNPQPAPRENRQPLQPQKRYNQQQRQVGVERMPLVREPTGLKKKLPNLPYKPYGLLQRLAGN